MQLNPTYRYLEMDLLNDAFLEVQQRHVWNQKGTVTMDLIVSSFRLCDVKGKLKVPDWQRPFMTAMRKLVGTKSNR